MSSNANEEEIIELGDPIGYIPHNYSTDDEDELVASQIQAFMFQQMLEMGYLPYPAQFPHDFILSPLMGTAPNTAAVFERTTHLSQPYQYPQPSQCHVHDSQPQYDTNTHDLLQTTTQDLNRTMPARSPSYYSRDRSRSRTRSPYTPSYRSRGRSRSRTPDSRYSRYSDERRYSDEFYSEDEDRRRKSITPPSKTKSNFKRSAPTSVRTAARKVGKKKTGAQTSTPRPNQHMGDVVTRRMLSARRLKINELKNEIDQLVKELDEIKRENKTLRRDNIIQNKQLDRFQDREGELPQLIDSHNAEVRALKEQIRKMRERNDKTSRTLRNVEDELSKSQKKVKKLQGISDDKRLEERDELKRRLDKVENDLEDKNNKIQHLERHIDNLEKTHKRELVTEMKKHAATKLELENTKNDLEYAKSHLRDKEKELEARNIYHNRIARAQMTGSVNSIPALEPPARYQPRAKSPEISPRHRAQEFEKKRREEQKAKRKTEPVKAKPSPAITSNSQPAAAIEDKPVKKASETPRQNRPISKLAEQPKAPETPVFEKDDSWAAIMKAQEKITSSQTNPFARDSLDDGASKRRVTQKRSPRQPAAKKAAASSNNQAPQQSQQVQQQQEVPAITAGAPAGGPVREPVELVTSSTGDSIFATEVPDVELQVDGLEEQRRIQEEEREENERRENQRRREEEQRKERQRREDEQKMAEEKRRRDEKDRQAREERERYEREERKRQQEALEERERQEKLAREAAERERRQREEEEKVMKEKEAEERARQARQAEKMRLESDAKAAEERKKKDLLLQKMKEIDTGSSGAPGSLFGPPAGASSSTDKSGGDFFLTPENNTHTRTPKDYSFRETDENLFRGLPAKKTANNAARNRGSIFGDEGKKDNPLFSSNKKDSIFNDNDDMDFGGYQPSSFGASNKHSKSKPLADEKNTWKIKDSQPSAADNKKTNVLDDLFSGSSKSTSQQPSIFDDDDFFGSNKPKQSTATANQRESKFPWEDNSPASDKMLPLRPRADNSTIHSKPTVRAIDSFDDDLEEVML